jgi:trk system potassium uptake protein
MINLRPVLYVTGLMLAALGGLMLVPAAADHLAANGNAGAFVTSALITAAIGIMLALATRSGQTAGFGIRQAYLLTVMAWSVLSVFASLPLMLGAPRLGLTDAVFEAVSGLTTTGSSVIAGLDHLPAGANLWRGMLNATGGLGVAFVAMIFLPVMRIGGMQFFRVQGYDTLGKLMPRASDIALSLLGVYAALTVLCILTYYLVGMTALDAAVMGMATISTGGFDSSDASFGKYPGGAEYAAALFMLLGSLPYIRFVQLVAGTARPLLRDRQVRAYLLIIASLVLLTALWRGATADGAFEPVFRATLFNITSVISTTGFSSGGFAAWGGFALVIVFVAGMIGGCSGSASGGLGVFRVQIVLAAIRAELRQIRSPNRVSQTRYDGRTVDSGTMDAVTLFMTGYVLALGLLAVGLTLTGVDSLTALWASWGAIGNNGYAVGPMLAATGTFAAFPEPAKWLLIAGMLTGRMALVAVLVVLMPRFWRG